MLESLLIAALLPTPLPQTPIIAPPEPVAVVELTLDEKIKNNVNGCNEDVEWISAEDASCIPKRVEKPPERPQNAYNGYSYRSCTWWVAEWINVPSGLGNARDWGYRWSGTVSSKPVVGAIAWTTAGRWGHVALVVGITDTTVTIREGNYDYRGSVRTRTAPMTEFKYLY